VGKMSRSKGKVAEREVATLLRNLGFTDARRGVQFRGTPDSPDVVGIPGAAVEVKRREAGNVVRWLEEAAEDAGTDLVPLVFHRRSRTAWAITLYAGDLWRLYRLLAAAQARGCDVETT
jgi:Holliday junction resolvase